MRRGAADRFPACRLHRLAALLGHIDESLDYQGKAVLMDYPADWGEMVS